VLEFGPSLLLLSSGFDAHVEDPSEVYIYTYIYTRRPVYEV
jgi:acetoin utilization deacetylase AcuC-like enzyme